MKSFAVFLIAAFVAAFLIASTTLASPLPTDELTDIATDVFGPVDVEYSFEPLVRERRRVRCTYYPGKKQPVCHKI